MASDKFTRMVRNLPSFYKAELNTVVRGLLKSWALSDDDIEIQLKNTKDQLFVDTAEGRNLDRLGSNVGVDRAPELGIDDGDFQDLIPVLSFFPKQVRATLISLLDVFWGPSFTRPNVNSGNTGPYNFGPSSLEGGTATFNNGDKIVKGTGTNFLTTIQPGDYIKPTGAPGSAYQKVSGVIDNETLSLSIPWADSVAVGSAIEIGVIRTLSYIADIHDETSIRFTPNAFADLTAVTIQELIDFINNSPEHGEHISASTFLDPITGSKLNIRTNTPGLQGSIQITGGDANDPSRLNFLLDEQVDTRAKVIEVNPNEIIVQIPSSVPVLRRNLAGSAHPREGKTSIFSDREVFDFSTAAPTENFRATFTGGTTADSGGGSLVGTIGGTGGAVVANKFVTGPLGAYIDYDKANNWSLNTGTVRFKFAPSFNGYPPNGFNVIYSQALLVPFLGNSLFIDWKPNGGVAVYMSDNTNTVIVNSNIAGAGSVTGVAGVEQEWELNYDLVGGSIELYVDGVLQGSLSGPFSGTQVDTAGAGVIRLGAVTNGTSPIDGTYDDLQIFTTVQHTSDFPSEIPRSLGAKELELTVDGSPYTVQFDDTNFSNPSAATSEEVATVINDQLTFLRAKTSCTPADPLRVELQTTEGSSEYQVTGGSANDILNFDTTLQQDPDIIEAGFPSAYIFDPEGQLFTVTQVSGELNTTIGAGTVQASIDLVDASGFPNSPGQLLFDFGRSQQEGPISYTSRPNNSTLLIDASHIFAKAHDSGRKVNLISPVASIPRLTGDDYPVYVTGTTGARVAAQDLIKKLLASGVVIRFLIDFPEFLFECTCRGCGPTDSPDQRGSLTGEGPLDF